jgi:hypothetical protein
LFDAEENTGGHLVALEHSEEDDKEITVCNFFRDVLEKKPKCRSLVGERVLQEDYTDPNNASRFSEPLL